LRANLVCNKFLFSYLFVIAYATNAFAGRIEVTDDNSPYLTYKYLESLSHNTPPNVKFYSNKDFTGKPTIVIDSKGLTIEDKLVCEWRDTYKENYDKRLLLSTESDNKLGESCSRTGPIISQYELFRIEVKNDLSNDFYEVTFNDKTLYLDKKQMNDFDFHESVFTQEKEKLKSNAEAYKSLKEQDKSLRVFLENFKKCISKKDRSCLPQGDRYEALDEGWQDYVCAYHNYSIVTESSYCEKWLAHRCPVSKGLQNNDDCDEILKSPRQQRPKRSKKTEKQLTNFLWKNLEGCFFREKEVNVDRNEFSTRVTIKTNEQYDLECEISTYKNHEKDTPKWELLSIRANPRRLPDTTFKIFGP